VFNANRVRRALSTRQDYWARTGLIEPSIGSSAISGSSRPYSARDIVLLKVVKRLLYSGGGSLMS
jgi:DNA-binding transcriptional MerR regulator